MLKRIAASLLLAACRDDSDQVNGELGHLSYSLGTIRGLESSSLTDVDIVTHHTQPITVTMGHNGERDAKKDAWQIIHRISPGSGATLVQEDFSGAEEKPDRAPSFTINAEDPGLYLLESLLNGEVFDRINISFALPTSIELLTWTRPPYGEAFGSVEGGFVDVQEGTQLAWRGIPLDSDGNRLAGEIGTGFSAIPAEMVVPAQNVYDLSDEDEFYGGVIPSLYFIEEGDITITLSDTVNDASATRHFTVSPA
jgi:hypothetical protein